MSASRILIKRGREHALARRHPWIYSGAISSVDGDPPPGAVLPVTDHEGHVIAQGLWNPSSQISVRVVSWGDTPFEESQWGERITAAIGRRLRWIDAEQSDAFRLVHGDADRLPGLIVDRYAEHVVVQLSTLGIEQRADLVFDALETAVQPKGIVLRVDEDLREKEGLERGPGVVRGEAPPDTVVITERGRRYHVDLLGDKTGFYLDQRTNRTQLEQRAAGAEVLDAFCYSGGFTVAAGLGGARRVIGVSIHRNQPSR